jgi:hypothetical protein
VSVISHEYIGNTTEQDVTNGERVGGGWVG